MTFLCIRLSAIHTISSVCLGSVPPELFMDYVPDIAAFKVLNFKGADSYICVVRACALSPRAPPMPMPPDPMTMSHRASFGGRSNSTCRSTRL